MKSRGIYVSPTEFVQFSEGNRKGLSAHIATRDRTLDFHALGYLLPNPDPILKRQGKDVKVYRDLRSDAHVGGCVRRRKAAVKALEWRVNRGNASARATKLCTALVETLDLDRLLGEIMEAVLFGWQPLEILWDEMKLPKLPTAVIGKPQEWFHFDAEAQLRFRSRAQPMLGEDLEPRKFLIATQEASYANPYGFADLSMCFWPTVFKRGGLKFWVQFTEKYGTPWVVGKQPRGTGKPETDRLLDQLEAMVQDAVAVIPDDSSVDIVEADGKGASAELYERLLMFCRSEVSIALLGQNQSTEASSTHASATAGLEVAESLRDGDARMVGATMNQLFRYVVDLNEGEHAAAPQYELFEEEAVNTEQATRDETLNKAGVKFTPQYWQRVYHLQPGDMVEAQEPAQGGQPPEPAFAEDISADDQRALDEALAQLPPEQLQGTMERLLQPLFAQLQREQDPQALLGWLAERFPQADDALLQEHLARMLFASTAWGRVHGV